MTIADSANRKHHLLRFSLRTLLLVMLLVCITLGWKSQRARKQREVVAWVRDRGGTVAYDYEWGYKYGHVANPTPPGPRWFRKQLGADFFDDVLRISIRDNAQLSNLTPLAGLTNLEQLELDDTQVTDITSLAGLTRLKSLSLDGTQVCDVNSLARLTSLDTLNLDATQVSDLTPLRQLTNLVVLELFGTSVRDLTPLAGLKTLKYLDLRDTQVSDVTPLAGLTRLERLDLAGTQVSDVTSLAGLTSLKRLDLNNTPVSQEDYEMLQRALPKCRIDWSPRTPPE